MKATIIIPVKEINNFLRQETVPAILSQTEKDFELLIITDKKSSEKFPKTIIIPSWPKTGPADKRDLGAKNAHGEILAFLDDDSYPTKDWLKNALEIFNKDDNLVGLGGPTLTPPHDSIFQKASGYVWSTWLGSGGAGTYRCKISPGRVIDDYPTVNFLVRKKDFWKVGGFDSHFWPGEDTKLCHDLVYKLEKKIIYDPKVLVYHHRREVFLDHLGQISRYAVHRGHFARILPKTSLKTGYLLPTIFTLGVIIGPVLIFFVRFIGFFYFLSLVIYFLFLCWTTIDIYREKKNLKLALLVFLAIPLTHLIYGFFFLKGFFSQNLKQ